MPWPLEVVVRNSMKVAVVRMNSNKVNAMNRVLFDDLNRTLDALEKPEYQKMPVVFTSVNPKAFSAGLDLKEISKYNRDELFDFVKKLNESMARILALPRRTVAAVNGHAIAGGCIFALACDARVAIAGNYKFGVNEVHVGFPFPSQIFELLRCQLPTHTLREATLSGKLYSPSEALANGMLNEVVSDNLEEVALKHATAVTDDSFEAYIAIKKSVQAPMWQRLEAMRLDGRAEKQDWHWVDTRFSAGGKARMNEILSKL